MGDTTDIEKIRLLKKQEMIPLVIDRYFRIRTKRRIRKLTGINWDKLCSKIKV